MIRTEWSDKNNEASQLLISLGGGDVVFGDPIYVAAIRTALSAGQSLEESLAFACITLSRANKKLLDAEICRLERSEKCQQLSTP